jgi:hypothetical protein
MRDDTLLPRFFVPHAPAGLQMGAIERYGATTPSPGLQLCDQVTATIPNHPRQARRQGRQAAFPRATARKAPMFVLQRASLAWQGIILVEKRQLRPYSIETAHNHDA